MKLLWDCIGTEFGGRHELYEINYGGSTEEIRRYCLFGAQASGNADRFKGFAEQCMAEYDLDGWTVPDLTDPGELSYHVMRGRRHRFAGADAGAGGTQRVLRGCGHGIPARPSPRGFRSCGTRLIGHRSELLYCPCGDAQVEPQPW